MPLSVLEQRILLAEVRFRMLTGREARRRMRRQPSEEGGDHSIA